ncbi:MAG TPA: hypothetical protein VGO76_14535 [Luteibacter sp.]|nr:hypothetical protein [Luteibacter sp.]
MTVHQRPHSTFHLAGLLQFVAFVTLLSWGIATHSHALNVALGIVYLVWLVVGSALILRRRWKRGDGQERRP